jgi:hypothetical protein
METGIRLYGKPVSIAGTSSNDEFKEFVSLMFYDLGLK